MTGNESLTPSWLTKEVLEKITSERLNINKVCIDYFDVTRAIPKGNNYVCDILRTVVHFYSIEKDEDKDSRSQVMEASFIIKIPKTGGMSEILMQMGYIQREQKVYYSVIPKFVGIYGGNVFTPCFYTSPASNVLIFDDLNSFGYKMADRRSLLTFEESIAALRALARFHAASVKCQLQHPQLIESFTDLKINERMRQMDPGMVDTFFRNASVCSLKWPQLERYSTKFAEYQHRAWDLLLHTTKIDNNAFNVLNHGDFWINNMLFKHSETGSSIIDVKLIDLQNVTHNTPALDLSFFVTGSVKQDVLQTRYNELLSEYLLTLNENLEKFGVERRLKMGELEQYMDSMRIQSLYSMLFLLPIVLCDESAAFDLSDISEEKFRGENAVCFAERYFDNELYVKCLAGRLEEFEKGGWP